ncbi:hypothetical protein ACCS61_32580 [Rhizobium ruizarguesonis]
MPDNSHPGSLGFNFPSKEKAGIRMKILLEEQPMSTDILSEFNAAAVERLYSEISSDEGVTVRKLQALVGGMASSPMSRTDLNAYRQGKKPWKRLREEVVPVTHFLAATYPEDTRVRFPLNSGAGDAWVSVEGCAAIGIEVTGALARSSVEVAKNMVENGAVGGFIALQDNAPQAAFDAARRRARVVHSLAGVNKTLDTAISRQLKAKDDAKYEGYILIVSCSLMSSPGRSESDWRNALGNEASALPFSQVYLVEPSSGTRIVRLK